MKAVLDTCVLYPTVMREVLLAAAKAGFFTPLWSARILEEWRRASAKLGPDGLVQADSEITLLRASWPGAEVHVPDGAQDRFYLPDPNDVHVLAAAVLASAEAIVTVNARDFPRHILAEEGVGRADPDALLLGFYEADPHRLTSAFAQVHRRAEELSGGPWDRRALLKKARLPRLAKAVG